MFWSKNQRDKNGRFSRGNHCAKQNNRRRKQPSFIKQIISPIDINRIKLENLKQQFFELPMIQGRIQRGCLFADGHYVNSELQNRPQKMIPIEPFLKYLGDYAPWDFIVLGGDMWDMDYLSHWNSSKFGDIGYDRISEYVEQEARDVHELLKRIKKISKAKRIYYMEGNHEEWLWKFQELHQKLGRKTLDKWLKLDELDITFIPVNGVLRLGPHAATRHGECYRTENPAKQAIMKSHRTYFIFHWHKLIVWPGYSDVDETEKLQAYCVPGMCNVATAEFMKNQPNNWSCGFLNLYIKPSGKFTPCIVTMAPNGNFIFDGKEYE